MEQHYPSSAAEELTTEQKAAFDASAQAVQGLVDTMAAQATAG